MSRLPTDIALGHLTDSLRALQQKPRDKAAADRTLLDNLERRLARAVSRDRTGELAHDGYPASTLGGGGSRSLGSSSTETAALARPLRDEHHELTTRAIRALTDAVTNLNTLQAALWSIEQLTDDRGPEIRTCAHCTGKRPLGGNQPVARRGTVGDRLTAAPDLCQACWDFVRQTANAGSHAGYLPNDDQILWHDQRGRWRLRVVAS